MSSIKEKGTIRQQSSENNSVSSSEWDMANDVFVSGFDDSVLSDSIGDGDQESAQSSLLDTRLPLDGMMLGLDRVEYSASSYLDFEPNYTESDGNLTTKKRIRSNSSRHRGDIVTELGPEEVRWFYKEDKRTWKPFVGHDSLKIEIIYRRLVDQNQDKAVDPNEADEKETTGSSELQPESSAVDSTSFRAEPPVQQLSVSEQITEQVHNGGTSVEAVCVRGGLYEVDIKEKECYPVYWNREHLSNDIAVVRTVSTCSAVSIFDHF